MSPSDRDLDEEIRGHLALDIQARIERGADPREARLAALREFGYVPAVRGAMHRVWYSRWVDSVQDLASDVRYALRSLVAHRAFTLTVVGVLTLGIGLNATVFTMVKSMALSPLAGVERASGLVVVVGTTSTGRQQRVSYPDYLDLRNRTTAFSALFGSGLITATLGRGHGSRQISAELVTGNYFQVLGVPAALGRTLLPSDEVAPGSHPVVVLSDALWQRDFAADPAIVGKTVEINNVPLTVVGVADPSYHGTIVSYEVEAFIPILMATTLRINYEGMEAGKKLDLIADRQVGVLYPHGFLRPGITHKQAAAEVAAVDASLAANRPLGAAAVRLGMVPFWQSPTGGQTFVLPTLLVLCAMGLLVLLIACANIAGLVLVRGLSRRGEIAVRLALGATRGRVVRLLILENLVLALPGAILGLALAQQVIPVLIGYAEALAVPQRIFFNVEVNQIDLAYVAVVGTLSAVVFGLVPALQSSRIDLVTAINQDASPRGAPRGRFRAALVVAQVAVSVLLLIGAGLTTRSLDAARHADPGFDASRVAAIALDLKQNAYDESRGRVFYRRLLEAARTDAGVQSVTLAAYTPLGLLDTRADRIEIPGYEPQPGEDLAFMSNTVGPDYFNTLRIPMIAGREFHDRDDPSAAPVVIVNHTFAKRFWTDATAALGRSLRVANGPWRTIVGVASDIKYSRINEPPRPYFYVPILQVHRTSMILHTRGLSPMDRLIEQARAQVSAIDPDLPILWARPLTQELQGAFIFYNLTASMLFVFGVAGMTLAGLGTYGLVSYVASQRTQEIGIRMALGASRSAVVGGFLARGLRLGVLGAGLGIAGALGSSSLLSRVLFGVSATDMASFTRAVAIVLSGVTLATLVPAWRAARMSPLSALRHH
jgi:predicted permease